MNAPYRWFALLALAAVLIAAAIYQNRMHSHLLTERARLQSDAALRARLRAERQRLLAEQVSAEESDRLRAGHEDFVRATDSILKLRRLIDTGGVSRQVVPKPPADPVRPPLKEPRREAADWKYTGIGHPRDTIESFLWSATQGEIDRLAALITFDPESRTKLEDMFAGLSDDARREYGSPERMAATLVSVQVPRSLSAYGMLGEVASGANDRVINLRVENNQAPVNDIVFRFHQDPDGWRLIIPSEVVADFPRALAPPPKPAS